MAEEQGQAFVDLAGLRVVLGGAWKVYRKGRMRVLGKIGKNFGK